MLIATLSFSKGRYSVFYIKGEVSILIKGKEVRLKEKDQLSPKDFVSVPPRCGLILKDEKGRRICVIKKPYRVSVKKMTSRYGSNSSQTHTVSYSLVLLHYSVEIIDSVIVHELAHDFVRNQR